MASVPGEARGGSSTCRESAATHAARTNRFGASEGQPAHIRVSGAALELEPAGATRSIGDGVVEWIEREAR